MVIMARMIFIIITIIIVMMVIVTKNCFHPSRCQDLSATWYTSAGPPPPILQRSISPIIILIVGSMIDAIQYLCFDLFRKTDSGGILSRLASNMIDHVRILRDGMWLIFPIHHFHLFPNHPCGNVFTKCVKEGLRNSSFTECSTFLAIRGWGESWVLWKCSIVVFPTNASETVSAKSTLLRGHRRQWWGGWWHLVRFDRHWKEIKTFGNWHYHLNVGHC